MKSVKFKKGDKVKYTTLSGNVGTGIIILIFITYIGILVGKNGVVFIHENKVESL